MVRVIRHQKSSGAFFRALQVIREELPDTMKMTGEEIDEIELKVIDTEPQHGDVSLNELMEFWLQEVGIKIDSRVQANRRAAANLVRKHGDNLVRQAIQIAAQARFTEFAPSVASFVDLQAKWTQLHLWAEKRAHTALLDKYEAMSIEDRVAFKQANPELAKIITKKRESM